MHRSAIALLACLFIPTASASAQAEPTDEQVAWLVEHAAALSTCEAGHGFDDLAALGELIGDARIVGLGESTHGSREIFKMKHRIVEYLASELGFTVFSIEANLPESYAVDEYVSGGAGDPKSLIGGMYFWTWNTEAVLDMVEWMRVFNESNRAADDPRRIAFTGFDMQFPDVALEIVRRFVSETDADLEAELAGLGPGVFAEIRNRMQGGGGVNAICTGSFPVPVAAGHTIEFSGWIRTAGVEEMAAIWWRADQPDGAPVFDNLQGRAPSGSTDWTRFAIELDIPKATQNINFGLLMVGSGTVWFDDLAITIDGEDWDPGVAFDFGFEAGQAGLPLLTPGYRAALDATNARTGDGSLRIWRAGPAAPAAAADPEVSARRIIERAIDHIATREDAEGATWPARNARVLEQYLDLLAGVGESPRDEAMAENVAWILEQDPTARIVLWAHNGHIADDPRWMGRYLKDRFGDDYVPLGFATGRGRYTAVGPKGLTSHDLETPPPASVEAFFAAAGSPVSLLDLRPSIAGDLGSGWLREIRPFRMIGAVAMDQQFRPIAVADQFDLLLYIEETGATIPLR